MEYPRVREAYDAKEERMRSLLKKNGISENKFRIHIRAYKHEKAVELWAKNPSDTAYTKLKNYDICALSGDYGPKRQQGDRQIPEGFYHIDRFNPYSNYHLSLGINYPNPSDRRLGVKGDLGGDIFIHGDCVTIGCIPITDPRIKELYIFCVEARDQGQTRIPVRIFPARMNKMVYHNLLYQYEGEDPPEGLWKDLLKAERLFKKNAVLPEVEFRDNGRHRIEKGTDT